MPSDEAEHELEQHVGGDHQDTDGEQLATGG